MGQHVPAHADLHALLRPVTQHRGSNEDSAGSYRGIIGFGLAQRGHRLSADDGGGAKALPKVRDIAVEKAAAIKSRHRPVGDGVHLLRSDDAEILLDTPAAAQKFRQPKGAGFIFFGAPALGRIDALAVAVQQAAALGSNMAGQAIGVA